MTYRIAQRRIGSELEVGAPHGLLVPLRRAGEDGALTARFVLNVMISAVFPGFAGSDLESDAYLGLGDGISCASCELLGCEPFCIVEDVESAAMRVHWCSKDSGFVVSFDAIDRSLCGERFGSSWRSGSLTIIDTRCLGLCEVDGVSIIGVELL